MNIVIDTSIVIAVLINEKSKKKIIQLTNGKQLYTPTALHWEIGNAFSAMLKRNRVSIEMVKRAIDSYKEIPLRFYDVDLEDTLIISDRYKIYAYDAYFIATSVKLKYPLLTLDRSLYEVAQKENIKLIEV